MSSPALAIDGLRLRLRGGAPILRDVSLSVPPGETHGLVGESGAGKSMIGKAIFGILPHAVEQLGGSIFIGGRDLATLGARDRRRLVGATTALIPQDPLTALNPAKRIAGQMTDRLTAILGLGATEALRRAETMLAEVQIADPTRVLMSYPHQLSGGMRQRVLIAAAFAAEPRLIVADEPTTALDVTVQKQILRLIAQMQRRHGTALLFVTHNLGVVAKICQSVSVLYSGKVVEQAPIGQIIERPVHGYTRALMAATPRHDDPERSLLPVDDAVVSALRTEIAHHDAAAGWPR
jgi:peptide/nickel transport system ATP-binding protein